MVYLRNVVCAVLATLLLAFDLLILMLSNKMAPVGVVMVFGINVLGVGLLWVGLPQLKAEKEQAPWTMILLGLLITLAASLYRGFIEPQ